MVRTVAALVIAAALPAAAGAQAIDAVEQRIVQWIDDHQDEQVAFLERVVNINSGTMNHEGVRQVGRLFQAELDALGFASRWVSLPDTVNRAGHLFAERRGDRGKRLLLIGHLDTVFEEHSPFQRFERVDSVTARGPGVEDMKGGNVVIVYALKALAAAGALEGVSIDVALTGDEEDTGDPLDVTRHDLIAAGRRAGAALGFEGGVGHVNTATVARRGFTGWVLRVYGRQGHSSQIFSERYGAGAIYEAARIVSAFYDELAGEEHLTFGAGIIVGGTEALYDAAAARGSAFGKTNVIPQAVTVAGDLRTLTAQQRERVKERMRRIVELNHLPGTTAEITFRDSYPPMAPTAGNAALLARLDTVSMDLGLGTVEPVHPGRRGAADVSFVAPYVDALDGLGPVGSGGHTTEETVDLRSLPIVTKRAALLIYRLTRGHGAS